MREILSKGLMPGTPTGASPRNVCFISGYASKDARNLGAGRQDGKYRAEIFYDPEEVFKCPSANLHVGTNDVLMVDYLPGKLVTMVHELHGTDKEGDGGVIPLERPPQQKGKGEGQGKREEEGRLSPPRS